MSCKISCENLEAKIIKENETKLRSIKGDVLKSWLNPHKSFSFFKTVELLPFLIFSLQLYINSIFVFTPTPQNHIPKNWTEKLLEVFFFFWDKRMKTRKICVLKKWRRRRRDVWVGWQVVSTTLTKQNKVENSENIFFSYQQRSSKKWTSFLFRFKYRLESAAAYIIIVML